MSNNIFKGLEDKANKATKVKFECREGKIRIIFEKPKGK